MISLLNKGVSIFKQDGGTALFRRALKKVQREVYYRATSLRGFHSLNLQEQAVLVSAPTPLMVQRNLMRFKSERRALNDFVSEIAADDVVYDIGANTGLYSLFAGKKWESSTVVSFEPYPPNVEILKRDISRNQLENISVVDVALSDSIGRIEFSQPAENDAGFGKSAITSTTSDEVIEVPTTTGDRLIADNNIPAPNVVKIDVEGAEPLVIEGLAKALSDSNCRTVYCEVHLSGVDHRPSVEDFDSSAEEIKERLESFGFTVEQFRTDRELEVFYKAQK